jgi:hypothetical protein
VLAAVVELFVMVSASVVLSDPIVTVVPVITEVAELPVVKRTSLLLVGKPPLQFPGVDQVEFAPLAVKVLVVSAAFAQCAEAKAVRRTHTVLTFDFVRERFM